MSTKLTPNMSSFVFTYVQNSTKKKCCLLPPIVGQTHVSDTMGDCMRSAPSATHFMPSINVTPKIQTLFFKLPLPLSLKGVKPFKSYHNFLQHADLEKPLLCT